MLNDDLKVIDYFLPQEKIARYPLEKRHESKLLVYKNAEIYDRIFREIVEILPPCSMLIFNDTRVIRARLHFRKPTGALIEIFCLEPYDPADYESAFAKTGNSKWKCLVGNLNKWRNEILEKKFEFRNQTVTILARKLEDYHDWQIIEFEWNEIMLTFADLLEKAGETPIPPYLGRESEPIDHGRYQTIYAQYNGSVAAPTAGLHFTSEVINDIKAAGISMLNITLHIGAGTFKPILANSVKNHNMHSEQIILLKENIQKLLNFKGNLIAVGTTSVRTLESLYWLGIKLLLNKDIKGQELNISQWEWTKPLNDYSATDSLNAVLQYMNQTKKSSLSVTTQLMILPGYEFRLIDGMITNFHQPRSTLLMLVNAFIGDEWKTVYGHAMMNNYRFLSYGDSSLLIRPRKKKI